MSVEQVQNENNIGNPYHDTSTGQFASKDGAKRGRPKLIVRPKWFLRSKKLIEDWKGSSMTVGQLKSMLSQVSEDERRWTGLQDFLDAHGNPNEKVSKQDVLTALQEPKLNEIVLGTQTSPIAKKESIVELKKLIAQTGLFSTLAQVRKDYKAEVERKKHGQYYAPYRYGEELAQREFTYKNRDVKVNISYNSRGKVDLRVYTKSSGGADAYMYDRVATLSSDAKVIDTVASVLREWFSDDFERTYREPRRKTQYKKWSLAGGTAYSEMLITADPTTAQTVLGTDKVYVSPHWSLASGRGTPINIVAHVRYDTRPIDGKKTLFIEEIQSDVHERGRKLGYLDAEEIKRRKELDAQAERAHAELSDRLVELERQKPELYLYAGASYLDHTRGKYIKNLVFGTNDRERQKIFINENGGIKEYIDSEPLGKEGENVLLEKYPLLAEVRKLAPLLKIENDAVIRAEDNTNANKPIKLPFSKTWDKLMLRRMIRHAAEHAFKQIGWTDGRTQSDRYNLSAYADKIDLEPSGKDDVKIALFKRDALVTTQVVPAQRLPEYIGVDAAKKYTGDKLTLSGEALRVGTQGMTKFYDNDIPEAAREIGKQFKVEPRKIHYTVPPYGNVVDVWVMDITPQMRQSVLSQGFPLFKSLAVIRMVR